MKLALGSIRTVPRNDDSFQSKLIHAKTMRPENTNFCSPVKSFLRLPPRLWPMMLRSVQYSWGKVTQRVAVAAATGSHPRPGTHFSRPFLPFVCVFQSRHSIPGTLTALLFQRGHIWVHLWNCCHTDQLAAAALTLVTA
jgi:hypothetical protein